MEKILITGSDGFIGSHLVEKLVREGYKVKAFVLYNSFNLFEPKTFPNESIKIAPRNRCL